MISGSVLDHALPPDNKRERMHIHELTPRVAPLGVQVSPLVHEERLGIVGTTTEGRIVHVVFTLKEGKVRPLKHTYAKSDKAYARTSVFERKKILAAAKRLKKSRKLPTSIALEERTINELKALAEWRGVPYQVLMRMFILEGLHKSQAAVAR